MIGADKMSSILDYTDRATCILFGDGAGAVLLEESTDGTGIINSIHYTEGDSNCSLYQHAGGSLNQLPTRLLTQDSILLPRWT